MAPAIGTGYAEESSQGITRSAISDGDITLRNPDRQKQDVAGLSRDTAQANGSISQIFDKEKEQKRLQTISLIGDIAGQEADIARTQGELKALEKARKEHPGIPPDKLKETKEYKDEQAKYGTGSTLQRGIQAATAALQGLAGGDIGAALAGAAAPELAHMLKSTEDNPAVNTLAHAILGGVTAALKGNSVAAGSAAGYGMSKYLIEVPLNKMLNPAWKNYEWVDMGMGISKPLSFDSRPSTWGTISGSAATEGASQGGPKAVEIIEKSGSN